MKELKKNLTQLTLPEFIKKDTIDYILVRKNIEVIIKLITKRKLTEQSLDKLYMYYLGNIIYLSERTLVSELRKIIFYLEFLIDKIIKELEVVEEYEACNNLLKFLKKITDYEYKE